jgi:ankyrin repeat protein
VIDQASGQPTPNPDILDAAIRGDSKVVQAILRADPGQAARRDTAIDSTPLHFAAHRGYLEIVESLLEAGGDVNAREGCSGATPLHWAAEGGHPEVARALVRAGGTLDGLDDWHKLPPVDWTCVVVHAPALHDNREATRNYLRDCGSPPGIFSAVLTGDGPAVRRIVGSRPEALGTRLGPASDGQQPLHFAIARGREREVGLLIELGAALDAPTRSGLTPLSLSVLAGEAGAERRLRRAGARTDLTTALAVDDSDTASRLLPSVAELLWPRGPYRELVHCFAARGHATGVQWLLRNGAEPNGPSLRLGPGEWMEEHLPLHMAAAGGHEAVVEVLLEYGADPDAALDRSGLTALHLAACNGHLGTVERLLAAGADSSIRDFFHHAAPYGWATYAGHQEVAARLADPGPTATGRGPNPNGLE